MDELIEAIINDANDRIANAKLDYQDQVFLFDELSERFTSLSIEAIRAGHEIGEY